jgi:hypothetical protein
MVKGWRYKAEGAVQEQLPRRGSKQVRPSHHLAYLHGGIIRHDSQLVRGHAIVTPDDKVTKIPTRCKGAGPAMSVGEEHRFPIRHTEPVIHTLIQSSRW